METRVVISCPHCKAQYKVRQSLMGKPAKCAYCKKIFDLVTPDYHKEEEIMDWLASTENEEDILNATIAGLNIFDEEYSAKRSASKTKSRIKLKLTNIDNLGAHFSFSSQALQSRHFRAAFPKICAECLKGKHLRVFLIRWLDQATLPKGFGAKGMLVHSVGRLSDFPSVKPTELLQYLPVNDELPEPYNLPFPYYVCDECDASDLVFGASSLGQQGHCLLRIKNISLACQFYAEICGTDTPDYHKLCAHCDVYRTNQWDNLPEELKERLKQWFKHAHGEHFICYVPDIDGNRNGEGKSGIIVTDQRIIGYSEPIWREYPLSGHITITYQSISQGVKIDIRELGQGRISFKLDSKSWVNLKHSLEQLKADIKFVGI